MTDDSAEVVTYVRAEHVGRDRDGSILVTFEGEYHDLFERRDGAWRIGARTVVHAWDMTRRIEAAFEVGRFTARIRPGRPI